MLLIFFASQGYLLLPFPMAQVHCRIQCMNLNKQLHFLHSLATAEIAKQRPELLRAVPAAAGEPAARADKRNTAAVVYHCHTASASAYPARVHMAFTHGCAALLLLLQVGLLVHTV
jgi:hypothetical protein